MELPTANVFTLAISPQISKYTLAQFYHLLERAHDRGSSLRNPGIRGKQIPTVTMGPPRSISAKSLILNWRRGEADTPLTLKTHSLLILQDARCGQNGRLPGLSFKNTYGRGELGV